MDAPLHIAICEDSADDREKLLKVLKICSIPSTVQAFERGEDLLQIFKPGMFDLILSDIYMDGITGVEAMTRIRSQDQQVPMAFITTSAEFALESYRLSALKYIEKPLQQRDIEEILTLARMKRDSAPSLTVQVSGREMKIRLSSILYLEQEAHRLNIVTEGESIWVYDRLSTVLPQVEPQGFFFSHKSFAVNLNHVMGMDPELRCFRMANGVNVPIRRELYRKAQNAFESCLFRGTGED